jgi:hypothetical protein
MKRISIAVCGLVLLACVSVGAQGAWKMLFNGGRVNDAVWTPVGMVNWKVVNNELWATNGNGFLVTKESFGDHEIRADIWVSPDANSGIFVRCMDANKVGAATCYEVNVYDTRPDQTYRTGGIVDLAKPAAMIDSGNKWNTLQITARGPRLVVRMNGVETVNVEDKKFARGPFALQAGVGVVRFRNVQVRELR